MPQGSSLADILKEMNALQKEMEQIREQRAAERVALAKEGGFKSFGERYLNDPVGFSRDCLWWPEGNGLTDYQAEVLEALVEHQRVSLRSAHGAGKTAVMSQGILWFALTREGLGLDWKAPITASVNAQLTNYLWPEVKKWARSIRWEVVGRKPFNPKTEMLIDSLRLTHGSAFCVTPDEPARMEGAHADHLAFFYDESKLVRAQLFDASEGAFSGAGGDTGRTALALSASTPGPPIGRFYEIQVNKGSAFNDWRRLHIGIDRLVAAGRVSQDWVEARRIQWGAESALFRQKVLGEFAEDEEGVLIPSAWVEAAFARWEANTS